MDPKMNPQASGDVMLSGMNGRLEGGPMPTIPCLSENCARLFHSDKEMRQHLEQDDHRSYCFKCKTDFKSPANLFIHKVTSKRHFSCPLCILDFHSPSGRDRHIQSNHLPDQNIACSGCGKLYKTASSLIKHIECNECPKIRISRMLLEQHRREQVSSTLHDRAMFGHMLGYFEKPAPVTDPVSEPEESEPPEECETSSESDQDQEGQGGVSIGPSQELTETALNKVLEQIEAEDQQQESGSQDSSATAKASSNPWPILRHMPNNAKHSTLEEVLLRNLRFDENNVMYNVGATHAEGPDDLIAWEEIEEEPLKNDKPATNGNFGIPLMPPTETMRQRLPGWNPRMHFDEEKSHFLCNACGYVTIHEREFEYHVAMEQRWITTTQCQQCGRIFSSTAALVAHMEQVRSRCAVRDSVDFARFLGDVTGGLIQVRGELEDGTDRIVARELEEERFKIIQRDDSAIEADILDGVDRLKRAHGRA